MKLLLLSNSTIKGQPYLGWSQSYLDKFLKGVREILFVPYAGVTFSYKDYTENVAKALEPTHTTVIGLHNLDDKKTAIKNAECIVVGGGNTFYLLHWLQELELIDPIKAAVRSGIPYIGWSAGSNVACPTIMTTNDMPILQPESFNALGLINFQINAHYTEKLIDGHGGESRDQRLLELLTVNRQMKVIGLPEGKLLELDDGQWFLKGLETEPSYLFSSSQVKKELIDGMIELV